MAPRRSLLLALATALMEPAGSQQQPEQPWASAPIPPQYWQAWMRMVVSREPPIPTRDPLFRAGNLTSEASPQRKEFERSLESDISMALSMRRAGAIDARNISFAGIAPFTYTDNTPSHNVTAVHADIHIVWSGESVSVTDVQGAIWERFKPDDARAPSECGIDMTYSVDLLQYGAKCVNWEHYEEDRGHCCPTRRWRRGFSNATRRSHECAVACVAPLVAYARKETDSRSCLVGEVCECTAHVQRRPRDSRSAGSDTESLIFDLGDSSTLAAGGVFLLVALVVVALGAGQLWLRVRRHRHALSMGKAVAEAEGEWLLEDEWASSDEDDCRDTPRKPLAASSTKAPAVVKAEAEAAAVHNV